MDKSSEAIISSLDASNHNTVSVSRADDRLKSPARPLYSRIEKWQTRVLRLHPGHYDERLQADPIAADMFQLETGLALHDELTHVE